MTNNIVTTLSYSQASSFKKQSVDLILMLPLGHERYADLSDNINNYNPSNLFARARLVYVRHVTEYSPVKTGEYPRIFPSFQNCVRCEKDLKDNKDNSLHLGQK